ncbi:MAG TPA: glycosyltransferase family 4 protein [Planctomycetota bacterium]|nr:glycosyltransferase family 4 protein [Planctomycetota bacterium]
MRVLVLGHGADTPSTRTRILQYLPHFERDRIEVDRVELPPGILGRWKAFGKCREADVVLHQKRLLPAWQFRALRRRAKKLVYDFDDPMVYARDEGRVRRSSTREKRFREILSLADAVVVHSGSEELAREYGARNVHVVPTPIDPGRWRMKESWASPRLTLGWAGTAAHVENLREIAPALAGRRVRIVADRPCPIPGADVEFVPWTLEGEPEAVRSFDVGLAPLPDDPWSRWKMPYKILTYFASGVPVVASRRGAVESVLGDGHNGLLAGDWAECFRRLEDPALRERLGRSGRATVERGFTVEVCYARLKAVLTSLV